MKQLFQSFEYQKIQNPKNHQKIKKSSISVKNLIFVKLFYQSNNILKKRSTQKQWIPKNFTQFQKKVLKCQGNQNVFRQSYSKGKFSSRLVAQDKQNMQDHCAYKDEMRMNKSSQKQMKKQFINDVKNYPFVQRYLNQTDLVLIYDKLKKSNVPKHKWIIFVVDQVHKKMKSPPAK